MTSSIEGRDARGVFDALRNLELRLLDVLEASAAEAAGPPADDPFRGLYITEADLFRCLASPAAPTTANAPPAPIATGEPFLTLAAVYGLSGQERDVLLIALAPEVDPRYEKIFAYLQDDVRRRRPSVDLVLNLLSVSAPDKLAMRALFDASAPLVSQGLISLTAEGQPPLLQREVAIDGRVAAFLLGDQGLDPRLSPSVRVAASPSPPGRAEVGLARLARKAAATNTPLPIFFEGADEEEKTAAAAALAAEQGLRLLIVDSRAAPRGVELGDWLRNLAREARLWPAIVYFERSDAVTDEASREAILDALPAFGGVAIVSGVKPLKTGTARLKGLVTVSFALPGWPERRGAWSGALRQEGLRAGSDTLDALAETFHFSRRQIIDAAQAAANLAALRNRGQDAAQIFEAARGRSSQTLASLTMRIAPSHDWNDIVLPPETLEQLSELCRRVSLRHRVMGEWGFARKLSGGKGVNALFHGHSGTGKTMAAEVIARELRLDLYKIDLAGVVSKYIGETEKNLDRIFDAAADASAILFFDEADALFGKRSEVRDSHDRYANLEVSYLLQKMEQHEGVSILATNLRQNLDDAFLRRLAFTIQFPFPDEAGRERIWAGIWPKETPVASDVDAGWLASRHMLSGGNIRNAALAAAYLAARGGERVTMSHVLHSVRAEFHKMGKTLNAAEMAPPLGVAMESVA